MLDAEPERDGERRRTVSDRHCSEREARLEHVETRVVIVRFLCEAAVDDSKIAVSKMFFTMRTKTPS